MGIFRENDSNKIINTFSFKEGESTEGRYKKLKRNMRIIMLLVSLVPLSIMAVINYNEYKRNLKTEILAPLRNLASKAAHSFDLYLDERLSTIRFIAYAYNLEELSDEKNLKHIFWALSSQYKGFIDLGVIDENGVQVSYAGQYKLKGKNYAQQTWFQEVVVRGIYVSDVFLGYRKFPHVAIAVQRMREDGSFWILRATLDTKRFEDLIGAVYLGPDSDVFLINQNGTLQTSSRYYGNVLEHCPLPVSLSLPGTQLIRAKGPDNQEFIVAYAPLKHAEYLMVVLRPASILLKSWYTLKSEMFIVLLLGMIGILFAVVRLTDLMVKRIQAADARREAAFRELQHSHKLSSIGRLAAGVAHEINNPMAIINEKAGLMKDIVEVTDDFHNKEKFLELIDSILESVDRMRTITHRLLGFAKRMEVQFEELNINDVIKEVFGFLEKEASYRNIEVRFQLDLNLPRIYSDRGQLQQVFLNLFTNAIQAVEDEGLVTITTWQEGAEKVGISIQDNGCGMSKETLEHIFEPFFTTKKGYGTGLGLSITYGIVKKLGGDIYVLSKESVGTTFTLFFPIKPKIGVEE
jgi:two-component system NtrC family sensor kinase